jgi:hypothetical protein
MTATAWLRVRAVHPAATPREPAPHGEPAVFGLARSMRVPTSTSVSLHTTRRMRCELPLDWFFHPQGRLVVADVIEAKHDDAERLQ